MARRALSDVASMRPGQSCPGVGSPTSRIADGGAPGFNEAGAIMPRSGVPVILVFWENQRFNEAGAIMPRSGRPPGEESRRTGLLQ